MVIGLKGGEGYWCWWTPISGGILVLEFNFAGYNNLSEGALHEVFPLLVSEVATVLILQISLRRMSASPEPVPILASTRIPFDCDDADCFVLKLIETNI